MTVEAEKLFDLIAQGNYSDLKMPVYELLSQAIESVGHEGSSAVIVRQHPLGFLCVKWNIGANRALRIHIWDRDMCYRQEPYWPIHDHVFSFTSLIIIGRIQNKIYSLSGQGGGRMCEVFEVDYAPGQSTLISTGKPEIFAMTSSTVYKEGQAYEMRSGIMHRTALRSSFAVTVLATTLAQGCTTARPRVLAPPGALGLVYNRRIAQEQEVIKQLESARRALLIS